MTQTNAAAYSQQDAFATQTSKQPPHYRMTSEMARWGFEHNMTTVKGYLFYLIKSSRKDGHKFRVKSVKVFCEELGISTSAYYKAIAELKTEGLIDFEVHGSMELWIPEKIVYLDEKKNVQNNGHLSTIVDCVSTIVDTQSTIVDTQAPKALSENDSGNPSDLLQSSINSFKERETREEKNQTESQKEEGSLNASASLNNQTTSSQTTAIPSEWDQFSAPGWDPKFFEYVVSRTPELPKPPVSPRCAAEGWIRKHGHSLYSDYLEWKEGQKRAAERIFEAVPVETVPVPMVEPKPMTPQKWLERYQGMWEADERSRQYIRKAIAQHPERGVCLGEKGPELVAEEGVCLGEKGPELVAEEGRSLQRADLSEGRSPGFELAAEQPSVMPEDFSDVLAGIEVEIRRLGWDASQLIAHLSQVYGKKSRQQLTDQELLNLFFCLQDEEKLTG